MGFKTFWKRLSPAQLNITIQAFSLIAIFFEGYDQGVMGGVNASPRYVTEVGIGLADGTVTETTKQGGIVSIYYLGAIVGCFVGGWVADRIGRINGIFYAAIFALVGGALQAATQSAAFILVARVVTGLGTGALTGIVPVLISEISRSDHRGGFLGYVFIANYLGISVAYWLSFGLAFVDHGNSVVRWRFLLGFQCIPALVLLLGIKMLPDSPRYYASVGRLQEARDVLEHVRGGSSAAVEEEYLEICARADGTKPSSPTNSPRSCSVEAKAKQPILDDVPGSAFGFRSWLPGQAVTAYSPVLLKQAGYSSIKQNGLAGGLNTIGIVGTIISAQIVDKLGRRICLMGGAAGLFAVNLIAASLYESTLHDPTKAASIAPAAVTMLFLFNLVYAATWGTVAFLVPTEIFPSEMRAQGNGFGITGWAIGVGWTVLVNPIMFGSIKSRTYFLFAALNLLWIPIVYLFYPETKDRSLESIEALFSSRSPFYWNMEKSYAQNSDVLAQEGGREAAERKFSVVSWKDKEGAEV